MISLQFIIDEAEQMERFGEKLADTLEPGDQVHLIGVLGAGKTTLVKGVARGLGYLGRVTSPTFTLMNVYEGRVPVYHIDLYRLENEEPGEDLEDRYFGDGVTLIEWPREQSGTGDILAIRIELQDDDYDLPRQLTLEGPADKVDRIDKLNR
ncbi:MAG: tRNA (adenosine(37)-N6)-threonylcarbamoyltransferase complex ATPase subunit type 1 TsaE [Candidatus Saccharibacteria bacterium]